VKMSWHDTPLEDSTSFGANRRDGQRTLARTVLSGALVILCIAAVPALISFSEESSSAHQGLDLATRDAKLSAGGKTFAHLAGAKAVAAVKSHDEASALAQKHKVLHEAAAKYLNHTLHLKGAAEAHKVQDTNAHATSGSVQPAAAISHEKKADSKKVQHQTAAQNVKEHGNGEKKDEAKEGTTAWEREQDDNFFDSLDKRRTQQEKTHLTKYQQRTETEDETRRKDVAEEHAKVEKAYLDAKKRFAAQRLAAHQYTQRTFAAYEDHRSDINKDSESGFKSIEAKELATEVERDHPNESAQEIAKRAMKLLKVVMHGGSSLPTVPSTAGPGPPLAPLSSQR